MRSAEKKFKSTSPVVPPQASLPPYSLRKKKFSSVIRTVTYAAVELLCFRLGVTVGLYSLKIDKNGRSPP
ncbi:MAG: hypothetical protein D3922_11480 [Candidatus Electrothrix sp. AR1]|nr:hypothetical protein [Candidatus Electrothrix sp. AR1]